MLLDPFSLAVGALIGAYSTTILLGLLLRRASKGNGAVLRETLEKVTAIYTNLGIGATDADDTEAPEQLNEETESDRSGKPSYCH